MRDFTILLNHCESDRQTEIISALIDKKGVLSQAAVKVGVSRQAVQQCVKLVIKTAGLRGELGPHKAAGTVPEGFYAETSVKRRLNPETGVMEVIEDWTKSRLDKTKAEEGYRHFIDGLCADITPTKPVKFSKKSINPHLATAIVFGDAHIGMLAHAIETMAEDVTLASSTADLRAAIDYCVDCAIPSDEGWFINLGDFVHVCGTKNTTHNGTQQDVSANHNQVMRAAAAVIRYCVDQMLTKFKTVTVVNARGFCFKLSN